MFEGDCMKKYLDFAVDIAKHAGKIMKKYFVGESGADYKYDNTIVTKADTDINAYLIAQVKKNFPDHSVDGEEEKFGDSTYVWVCDPVDGTAMFARHLPLSVFSLALVVNGEPRVGVVYDPWTDNMYTAIKGHGAYRNDTKIHVSDISIDDKRSVIQYDMWKDAKYDVIDIIRELGHVSYCVSIGSIIRASMCVATGDFTMAVFPGGFNKHVDIAAVKVIVEEAGGRVTDMFGDEQRYDEEINGALISNGVNHDEVLDLIRNHLTNKK